MKRLILSALLALVPLSAAAQSGVWGMRGISRDFALADGLLFAADGRGLAVYEVNGAPPHRVDVALSEFETVEVAALPGEAFVASGGGVLRYVVGLGGRLTPAGVFTGAGAASHVAADAQWVAAASGQRVSLWRRSAGTDADPLELIAPSSVDSLILISGRLYVAARDVGILVYDPATRQQVTFVPVIARDLALSGNILWAAAGTNGVASIDVTNPSAPVQRGISADDVEIHGIAVAGTRVYGRRSPSFIAVFDGSDVRAPRLVKTIDEPVTAMVANASRLFVSGSIVDEWGLTNETGKPVRVLDGATLASQGDFEDLAGPISGVATDGSLAWVVDPPYFRVLDVSSTTQPVEIAAIRVEEIQDSVRVKNGLAIIYGRGLVNLVDVVNPYKPRYLGTYRSTGRPPGAAAIARNTFVEANYASGLHVVDYGNPANPVQIAGRIWHYTDLATSDDVLYALLTDITLLVADISDRNRVVDVSVGHHDAVQLDIAPPVSPRPEFLVTRSARGFQIFSLADPLHPTPTAFIPVDRPGLMGTGDAAVYYEHGGTLWSIDLRNPADPVDTTLRVTSPMQIAAAGGKVVVADRYALRIFGPDTPRPRPQSSSRRRAVGR